MPIGTLLNNTMHRVAVPELKKFVTKKEGERIEKFFKKNTGGIRPIEE